MPAKSSLLQPRNQNASVALPEKKNEVIMQKRMDIKGFSKESQQTQVDAEFRFIFTGKARNELNDFSAASYSHHQQRWQCQKRISVALQRMAFY